MLRFVSVQCDNVPMRLYNLKFFVRYIDIRADLWYSYINSAVSEGSSGTGFVVTITPLGRHIMQNTTKEKVDR